MNFVACSDSGSGAGNFDAAEVCPAEGVNAYGMANRGTFVDERDGRTYSYTTIGNQVWMAENLNYKTEYSACYDDDEANCEVFGRLYFLTEKEYEGRLLDINKIDAVCPAGWHLPIFHEFEQMVLAVGNWDDESTATKLKSSELWNSVGTDDCGFSAIPAGMFNGVPRELTRKEENEHNPAKYKSIMGEAHFWTATMKYIYMEYISLLLAQKFLHTLIQTASPSAA
ncbi:FISUMP domain-containing protein [uncultured Fibrobacter sp.]|uniref:FISUMP domain-containing protein n=1 Tax=uncultured Fibrobacter sp. TaxID=261512 RepID=UPI00280516AF|nr:FISUMP domain-containing protein [uncultured Fibrobacter sp.]